MKAAVRLGVVLLCHGDLDLVARLARIWTSGGARVALHVDAKVSAAKVAGLRRSLQDCDQIIFSRRHRCSWGRFSLVRATQDAAAELLQRFPDTTHVYLASGACLPLRPISDLTAYLAADPDRDQHRYPDVTIRFIQVDGTAHGDQSYHTTDRDIDPAGDHDDRHTDRRDDQSRIRI